MEINPLWTALITPQKEDGRIDSQTLETLIRAQTEAGNGVIVMGSTGEGMLLSDSERLEILECVSRYEGTGQIFASVGGCRPEEVINRMQQCRRYGVSGFLLSTPLYSRPGPEGQYHWFARLLDAAELPCMLYNIPSRTGVTLSVRALERVSSHPNCLALKEASGSFEQWRSYRRSIPELPLLCGNDDMIWQLASEGSKGSVSVIGNLCPQEMREYVIQSLNAQPVSPLWHKYAPLICQNNPTSIKRLMHAVGMIASAHVHPPLDISDGADLDGLLEAYRQLPLYSKQTC